MSRYIPGPHPEEMKPPEKTRVRAAAYRATRLYPGPVGELLSQELMTWEEFGYRLGGSSLMMRVVDEILKAQLPERVTPGTTHSSQLGQSAVGYGT